MKVRLASQVAYLQLLRLWALFQAQLSAGANFAQAHEGLAEDSAQNSGSQVAWLHVL